MCWKNSSFSFHEVLGAITVGLVSVSMGLVSGFGTISLADLPLDADQGSWFVSIDLMIAIPFAPLGGQIDSTLWDQKYIFDLCSTNHFGLDFGRILPLNLSVVYGPHTHGCWCNHYDGFTQCVHC